MRSTKPVDHRAPKFRVLNAVKWTGYVLAFSGCLGILLGIMHIFDMQIFAFGLSSGIRLMGSVGISGCLLSAVGHAVSEQHLI